jgi:hypothetical protein
MSLELTLAAEVWEVVKPSVISSDRQSVADNLISMMIDNGYSVADIKAAFRNDSDIIDTLKYYVAGHDADDWTDEDDDDDLDSDNDDEW